MTRDELSSVLLKLIGFAVAAHAILGLAQLVITLGVYSVQGLGSQFGWQILAFLVGATVQVIGGFFIIAKSSAISQWLFAFGQGKSGTAEPADE